MSLMYEDTLCFGFLGRLLCHFLGHSIDHLIGQLDLPSTTILAKAF
jgi:hypothetical protein